MKITSIQDVGIERIKMIVIGESGVGKTSLAATIGEPTLIVSAESGLLSLRSAPDKLGVPKEWIDLVQVADISQDDQGKLVPKEQRINRLIEIFQWVQTDEARKQFKWIVIDSLTEISNLLFYTIEQEFRIKAAEKGKEFDGRQVYGEFGKKLTSLITHWRDLPGYCVLFTCLPAEKEDKNTGEMVVKMMIPGSMAQQSIPGLIDEILYMRAFEEDGELKRVIQTQPTNKIPNLKDRSGKLDPIEEPNLNKIATKIRG